MNHRTPMAGPTARATSRARQAFARTPHPAAGAPRRSALHLALATVLGISLATPAQAVGTLAWTGQGGNANWSTSTNWTTGFGGSRSPQDLDSLVFNNQARLVQVVDISRMLTDISFSAGAGGFTFNSSVTPQALTHLGNITNSSSFLQTFNVRLSANGSGTQNWNGGSVGMVLSNAWLPDVVSDNTLNLQNKVALTNQGDALLGGVALANSTLNILSGSSATTTGALTLGRDFGSQGTVLVGGLQSKLTSQGDLTAGHGSTGTLTVQNGGVLNSGNTFIGKVLGGDGLVVVSGTAASWVNTGNLSIGEAGAGSVRVEAGGKFNAVGATFGHLDGSAGTAKVTGANSSWVLSADLQIGKVGEGSLFVEHGGLVSNRHATVGTVGDAGASRVQVTGAGASWQNSGDLTVHSGSLTVADGGVVSAKNGSFGLLAGSAAMLSLSGTGATLSLTDNLWLGGDASTATLNLGKGAVVNSGAQLIIGKGGVINLNGGTLNTGWSLNAGQVNWISGTVNFLGSQASGSGILDHSVGLGDGMNMTVNGDLFIQLGDGISLNGGQVQTQSLYLQGELSVGSFSQLSVGTGGMSNTGALQLAGGTLSSTGSMVSTSYLSGHGKIDGAGGFSNTGLLRQAGGSLNLAAQGSNINTGIWEMLDGRGLVLSGGNLLNSGEMRLNGDVISGSATLTNASTGTLSGRGVVTAAFQNDGRLVVDTGSFSVVSNFNNTGQVLLGSAAASLAGGTIANSGRILGQGQVSNAIVNTGTVGAVGGTLTLEGSLTNNGLVSAGLGGTVLVNRGLASNAGKIQLAGGAFDNNGKAMTNEAGATINGFGSLSGGLLTNKGKVLLSGGNSTINSDVLSTAASQIILSGNSNSTFYGTVDVQSGAELRVSTGSVATFFGTVQQRTGSKFTGSGAKRFEGTLSVGASPGLGSDEGDVEFGDSSTYLAEIGGTTACTLRCDTDQAFKNTSFDKYTVAGNLSLNGTLKLTSWNGFVGQAGESFDLLDWGTLTGTFATIDASGFKLAAGTVLDTSALYTTGTVSITAVPEPGSLAMMLSGLLGLGMLHRRRPHRA